MTMSPLSCFFVSAGGVSFCCSFGFSAGVFDSCMISVITGSVSSGSDSLFSVTVIGDSACISVVSGGSSLTVSTTVLVGSITGVSADFVVVLVFINNGDYNGYKLLHINFLRHL